MRDGSAKRSVARSPCDPGPDHDERPVELLEVVSLDHEAVGCPQVDASDAAPAAETSLDYEPERHAAVRRADAVLRRRGDLVRNRESREPDLSTPDQAGRRPPCRARQATAYRREREVRDACRPRATDG